MARIADFFRRLRTSTPDDERYWYTRYAKSVIFVCLAIAIAGEA